MNLIICLTPLQALLAQALIRAHAPQPFDLLMVCYESADNAKFRHYFRQTAALCRDADYVLMPEQGPRRKTALPPLLRRLQTHYACVFAASIDNPCVQYVLSQIRFDALETFDDGSGNLTPGGILYRNPKSSLKSKIVRFIKGIRYQTEDLRRLSRRHHTLYPGRPNIAAPTVPVDLWSDSLPAAVPVVRHCRILLGQPVFDDSAENVRLAAALAAAYRIDHYFPHPREHGRVPGLAYIDTELIFEDWLTQALHRQPETEFHIYHLASTAALNAAAFPRTKIHSIRPPQPVFRQGAYAALYALTAELGIPVEDWVP